MLFKKLLLLFTLITVGSYLVYAASTSTCYDLDDTSLMMHMDGTNGSTNFIDETGKTVTRVGSKVVLSTDSPKFGSASVTNFSTTSYLTLADDPAWKFGTGAFTIDFWVNFDTVPSGTVSQLVVYNEQGSNNFFLFYGVIAEESVLSTFRFYFKTGNVYYLYPEFIRSNYVTPNVWHHFAITRDGNNFRILMDGTQLGSPEVSSGSFSTATGTFTIGEYGTGETLPLVGKLDELRIVKGVAIWTGNFTPPSAPYSDCDAPVGGAERRRISICSGD